MRSPARFLLASAAEPPSPLPFDSDVVVILAVLLCALICVVGLALFARCAWQHHAATSSAPIPFLASPNKGLKMKVVRTLPTLSFNSSASASSGVALLDCPICLAEFADGEIVRVLPQCGHGFHAKCVDTWFRSQSSCPTCRRNLAVAAPPRCQQCGASSGAGSKVHDGGASRFELQKKGRNKGCGCARLVSLQIDKSTSDL